MVNADLSEIKPSELSLLASQFSSKKDTSTDKQYTVKGNGL